MATQLQIRRGTTAQMNAFTGAEGELAVNTTTDTLHVHDGATAGGKALARADGSNIATYAGSFTTLTASGAATLNTLASSGATLSGGTINGMTVGASTPSTGAFTTISASGAITGNVTGNLTGSVLTAAQTNITSVGTLSTLSVSGEITANGGIALGDGDVATFGDSDDLSIFHAGGTTYLTNTTGSLVLRTDSFRVLNTANSEQILHGDANGAVTAYYDNSAKLATTSTGIDVTGTATMDSLGVGGTPNISSSSGTGIFTIKNTGTNRAVREMQMATATATGIYAQESFYNGSTLATLIQHGGDGGTDSGYIKFFTKATGGSISEKIRISASGNLLVNTSSFGSLGTLVIKQLSDTKGLALVDDSSTNTFFIQNLGSEARISHNDTSPMTFFTNNTEAMRLSHDKQLSLATTENKARMTVGLTGVSITGNTDGATMGENAIVHLLDSNSGAANSTVMLLGGSAGAIGQISSGIGFSRESASNWGTQLRFYTHSTATSDLDELNEAMRLNSSGELIWHDTPSSSAAGIKFQNTTHPAINISGGSDTNFRHRITFTNGNGIVGIISTGGSATSYATSSDYRLKENVVAMSGATERLKQLKPSRFNFIADADTTVDGFLAHEVQDIVPEAITGAKDAVDADGNPDYQGIDQSKLVPLLVATIQELEARLTALENK